MEHNDYFVEWQIRERLTQTRAAADRARLAAEVRSPRRPLRVALGVALIHGGAWLLRERYAVRP